jgi:Flp pilus assembly protein TadG
MKQDHNPKKGEKGQSLVEMTFGVIVLLLLVGGIVDLGRAFFSTMTLRDAVQEGALYGSIDPTNTTAIKNHVLASDSRVPDMISSGDINVQVLGPPCAGNRIQITANYNDFPITMPFIGAILGGQTYALSATVTDTILRPACIS